MARHHRGWCIDTVATDGEWSLTTTIDHAPTPPARRRQAARARRLPAETAEGRRPTFSNPLSSATRPSIHYLTCVRIAILLEYEPHRSDKSASVAVQTVSASPVSSGPIRNRQFCAWERSGYDSRPIRSRHRGGEGFEQATEPVSAMRHVKWAVNRDNIVILGTSGGDARTFQPPKSCFNPDQRGCRRS